MGWPVERILEVAAVELAVAWYDAQRPGLGTEFLEALRASVPKVCAVGMSPTSALFLRRLEFDFASWQSSSPKLLFAVF
jgi:hypothetical protein